MFSQNVSSTGRIAASVASFAPTRLLSRPASASLGERVSGASAKRTFFAASALATCLVELGSAVGVDYDQAVVPAGQDAVVGEHALLHLGRGRTHRIRMSLARAMAAGLFASVAPRASRSSIGARLRCASTSS